jgi:hypothetical protein
LENATHAHAKAKIESNVPPKNMEMGPVYIAIKYRVLAESSWDFAYFSSDICAHNHLMHRIALELF